MMIKYILLLFALTTCIKSTTAASCGICADGVAMNNPNKTVPLFDGDGFDEITCQEKDAALASNGTLNDDGECILARGMFEIDMAVWCGCEGAETTVNNGDCTLCQEGEEFTDRDDTSGLSGYPLTNTPDTISCEFVREVAPLVRYINTCDTFHKWYGTGVCCFQAFVSEAPTPVPPPTSSANQDIVKRLFVVAGGLASSLLFG